MMELEVPLFLLVDTNEHEKWEIENHAQDVKEEYRTQKSRREC